MNRKADHITVACGLNGKDGHITVARGLNGKAGHITVTRGWNGPHAALANPGRPCGLALLALAAASESSEM